MGGANLIPNDHRAFWPNQIRTDLVPFVTNSIGSKRIANRRLGLDGVISLRLRFTGISDDERGEEDVNE